MPPKTPEDERRIWKTIRELESLQPSFVSVTYGAGGSTRDNTIKVVEPGPALAELSELTGLDLA